MNRRSAPTRRNHPRRFCVAVAAVAAIVVSGVFQPSFAQAQTRWWKGNLHTHSLWSDGDEYPEMVVGWYKQHGYHFLALSDHNRMLIGDKWVDAVSNKGGQEIGRAHV